MKLLRPILGISLSFLLLTVPAIAGQGAQLVRLFSPSKTAVKNLAKSGADIVSHGHDFVEVVVPALGEVSAQVSASIDRAMDQFDRSEVIVKDLDAQLAARFKGQPDLGVYHTVAETHDELAAYAKNFP